MEIETMNTASLAGQLFVVDFSGPEPDEDIERLVRDGAVGGVILFDKNIVDPPQVARLTNALQRLAARAGIPPLLVAADQEGGPVVRLRGTQFPSAMAFGAAADESLVAAAAGVTARELRAVGIHMNCAPVLDVNNNPENPVIGVRSFGEDPARVAGLGSRAITAMQAAGVLATAKHFPGHGDTSLDSHLTLPIVAHPRSRLDAVELLPFREAIRAGVGAVMTAHVVYPALDRELPATLSPAIIRLLRETLGFDGLVVSDSMQMRAVADHYTPGAAAVAAVRAGVDVVLACGPVEAQWEALEAVRSAARQDRIGEARVRQAAQRVLAAKRRLGLFADASVAEGEAARFVGCPEHLKLAERVAAAAATVVRDARGTIPLPPGPVHVATDLVRPETADRLAAALRSAGRMVRTVRLNGRGGPAAQAGVQGAIVVPFAAAAPEGGPLAARVREATLAALKRGPAVAVSLDAPYPLAGTAEGCAALAVYGADPHAIAAAAGVLAGTIRASGTLPVTMPLPPDRA